MEMIRYWLAVCTVLVLCVALIIAATRLTPGTTDPASAVGGAFEAATSFIVDARSAIVGFVVSAIAAVVQAVLYVVGAILLLWLAAKLFGWFSAPVSEPAVTGRLRRRAYRKRRRSTVSSVRPKVFGLDETNETKHFRPLTGLGRRKKRRGVCVGRTPPAHSLRAFEAKPREGGRGDGRS